MHAEKNVPQSRGEKELELPRSRGPKLARRPTPSGTDVLTRQECAAWLGISVRQLTRLDVPCAKLGRLVRYSVPAVLRWLEERGQP
jgi:hypothetical protein